jgi:hypothetical protein
VVWALAPLGQSGNKVAAKTEGAFSGTSRPDWPEIDANGRKNWDMENCQEALGELFRLLKLEGDAAESKVEDAGAAAALITDDSVSVGAGHGDTFRLALYGERCLGNRFVSLF